MSLWLHRRRGERGSVALTTAIFAPAVLALLVLLIAAGRIRLAQGEADSAARDAARTASLERDPGAGEAAARSAAQSSLSNSGLHCRQISVSLNTDGLAAPLGQAATVTATVSCTAPLSDIAMPGIGGSKELKSTMTSVVDTWRARTEADDS
ncbi:pilus assembly protein [Streptomyces sp. NBC_00144]|uniref:TadE/TadG family type IV pilus assembly protein n=1 Tax=Streptomyces sp. NBC_00144 TaxID=2975665 RepID=UPI00324A7C21